jgi:hypothetical protein
VSQTLRIYGVAQPTIQGVKNLYSDILHNAPSDVIWINLREEALIYINGIPFVLRDEQMALRNVKAFAGINASRLELMEERLRDDVMLEIESYDDRILVHTEKLINSESTVVGKWEDATLDAVHSMRTVMTMLANEGMRMHYYRVPITAEAPPDEADFDSFIDILTKHDRRAHVVVNDQVGLGRSTLGAVIVTLIRMWLDGIKRSGSTPTSPNRRASVWPTGTGNSLGAGVSRAASMYRCVHSLMRVVKNGLDVKRTVDDAIDICASYVNLRDAIRQTPAEASASASSAEIKRAKDNSEEGHRRAVANLRRYYILLVFQAFLDDTSPDATVATRDTFSSWMEHHPELKMMQKELSTAMDDEELAHAHLVPIEAQTPGDGIALTSEVLDVVGSRAGSVLARQTILKHDAFPGCQKLSLLERLEGAPNFRHLTFAAVRTAVLHVLKLTNGDREDEDAINGTIVLGY